jgi:undecaprenyl-diphosphatase
MSWFDALLLGAVQGLTEFLPVSSSGHLRLGHDILGAHAESLFFDILLHVGSLIAVLWVYRHDNGQLLRDAFAGLRQLPALGVKGALQASRGLRMALLVVLATIPTGIIGILAKDAVEGPWMTTAIVSGLLLVNGTNLFLSKFIRENPTEHDTAWSVDGIDVREALIIGIAQGIAVLPGISRSGTTIMVALMLGIRRERAAQFSFLLSIPAILGAAILSWDASALDEMRTSGAMYFSGALVSCIVGVLALQFLLRLLRKAQLHVFAWYCWALGIAGLVWSLLRA